MEATFENMVGCVIKIFKGFGISQKDACVWKKIMVEPGNKIK